MCDCNCGDEYGVDIIDFDIAHVAALVDAHCECFPGSFLTLLGKRFLMKYYGAILESGLSCSSVAILNGSKIVSFAVGCKDRKLFLK